MKSIFQFLGREAGSYLLVVILGSLFLAAAELGISLFIQVFLRNLGLASAVGGGLLSRVNFSMTESCGLLFLIALLRSAGLFLVGTGAEWSFELIQQRLRLGLASKILFLKEIPGHTSVQLDLTEMIPKASRFALYSSHLLSFSLQMIVLVMMMIYIAWKEAFVSFFLVSLIGFFILKMNKKVRYFANSLPGQQEKILGILERIVSNWLLVFILRTGQKEFNRVFNAQEGYVKSSKWTQIYSQSASAMAPLLGIIVLIFIILLSQNYFLTPDANLLLFLFVFIRLVQNISSSASFLGLCNSFFPHFKRSFYQFKEAETLYNKAILNRKKDPSFGWEILRSESAIETLPEPCAISFKGVEYTYPGSVDATLVDFNLDIKMGEQIGIVGPSGSGKSTLLALLMGVITPQKGLILVNNLASSQGLTDQNIRVSFVGPEPFLFEGTLKENLLYGTNRNITDAEIIDACNAVLLFLEFSGEDVTSQILLSNVKDGGKNFSTGQRQRLCFARAILNRPELLILDEVSANLDTESEVKITQILSALKGKCTVIIVSHRQGVLKYADRIIDLANQGRKVDVH